MTAQELKETGRNLYDARRYAEAVPLLKSAAEALPTDETLWQELVLAAHHSGQCEQAIDLAKQAIRHHPRSGWLWRQLGCELTAAERLEEAEKALNNARSLLNQNDEWTWRYFAALYRKRKNLEKEIDALLDLHAFGKANARDLNQLGIAYHNNRQLSKALEFYRLSADTESDTAPHALFNMGLVFSDPDISQDADAADAYRRALALSPDHEPAKKSLESTKQKLLPLAGHARTMTMDLIQSDDLFSFYVNPFEVLQIEGVEPVEELDVKAVQRAKKRLLQEIDLNEGRVHWLDDYRLDKSRALAIEDELHDEAKRRYHAAIFQDKRLLRFLTRGDIEHFLYSEEDFPEGTLELLDEAPGFRAFLSKPFARQYNLVLTRAIDHRLLPAIEVLLDGRRWVEPEDDDICFDGAFTRIRAMVELLRAKIHDSNGRKVSLPRLEDLLRKNYYPELFNLLPTAFASFQRELVAEIRSLAVSCYNEHNDSDLSQAVLNLCKRFTFRSVELTAQLEEDFKTIERVIVGERKHECHLQFVSDRPFAIPKVCDPSAGFTRSDALDALPKLIDTLTAKGCDPRVMSELMTPYCSDTDIKDVDTLLQVLANAQPVLVEAAEVFNKMTPPPTRGARDADVQSTGSDRESLHSRARAGAIDYEGGHR